MNAISKKIKKELKYIKDSGLYKKESDFRVENESDNLGQTPLHILGYSGITAPNSYLESRDILVDSQGFFPTQRSSTFFAESEIFM